MIVHWWQLVGLGCMGVGVLLLLNPIAWLIGAIRGWWRDR